MSFAPPPPPPDDPVNPFAAPATEIGTRADDLVADTEAEAIRRAHLSHEASVQSVGTLYYLGAVFGAIGTIGILISAFSASPAAALGPGAQPSPRALLIGIAAVYAVLTGLNFALGYGLQKLQGWARWTVAVLTGFSLLYALFVGITFSLAINPAVGLAVLAIGGGISGYILYLMVSPKGSMVFSPRYKAIIAQTPHIRYRTSLLVKILLIVIVALIVVGIFAAVFSSR